MAGMIKRVDRELIVVDLTLLAIAVFMYTQADQLAATPRRAPIVALTAMIMLILTDLGLSLWHAYIDKMHLDEHGDKVVAPLRTQLGYIAALVACGLLMYNLGYRLATPIFLTGFLVFIRVPIRIVIPYVGGVSLFMYYVFSELLNVR
jgi:hypothetical protein